MRFYRTPRQNPNIVISTDGSIKPKVFRFNELDWYAVRTPPHREFIAELLLQKRGYAAICPVNNKRMKLNRTSRKKKDMQFPLLPSYILIGFKGKPNWAKLFNFGRRAELVTQVCGFNGRAQSIPEHSMIWVARMLKSSGIRLPDEAAFNDNHLDIGDEVDVIGGPLSGHSAYVENITGKTALCLISLFGGQQKTKIDVDSLQKAA